MNPDLIQLRILHFSDLHFGAQHRFQAPLTPGGDRPTSRGIPTLAESLLRDLSDVGGEREWLRAHQRHPLIMTLSGDLTQAASPEEFDQASAFIRRLQGEEIAGSSLDPDTTFVVPGNHDVTYTEPDPTRRWSPFCEFYEDQTGHRVRPREAYALTRVRDLSSTHRVIVAEINTCFDVRKGTPDEHRGHVSNEDIDRLEDELRAIDPVALRGSARIAVMHHHPVILPSLAEAGRGYDAVLNAHLLLRVLRDFGFHLIIHGHKHLPHMFSYDPTCAWTKDSALPMIIVSGGSAGSVGLPEALAATNTYNLICLKWNPTAGHGRVRVETRGLLRFDAHDRALSPSRWRWTELRTIDRMIAPEHGVARDLGAIRPYDGVTHSEASEFRRGVYTRCRGNMVIAEVVPSLLPEQCYDVRVRVVQHRPQSWEPPVSVEWSCGPSFPTIVCARDEDPSFEATFSYWDSMLVCASMTFADGASARVTVYAHIPGWRERADAPTEGAQPSR